MNRQVTSVAIFWSVGVITIASVAFFNPCARAAVDERNRESSAASLADVLRQLRADGFTVEERAALSSMVRDDQRRRLQAANDRSRSAWLKIRDRDRWEQFREPRLAALRKSLGDFPDPPRKIDLRVTGRIDGDGFRIENLVFHNGLGLWVTANLYLPSSPTGRMPGVLICHSHHRPKEHGELQDMGMTWARAGCAVLVMDQLGHGERRQHPFRTAEDFQHEYRVSRQDYYFRYDVGMQLHLVGESLMGWMVWDLMRGVDVLSARADVDPKRIILLGAVAGGGDPAAVAAALDDRIAAAVPFNFGGPQPETRYPLPEDAETSFNYAGSGSWESTRNLRRSAADGFLPWVIVGGIAPRRLVFAHEFAWHRERDPVWKRLQTVYSLYDVPSHLAFTHGRGELKGRPPESTHCTHIGQPHRVMIHAAFEKWFGIRVDPDDEYSNRLEEQELLCMTAAVEDELKPRKLHEVLMKMGSIRIEAARAELNALPLDERRKRLRERWSAVLGRVAPDLSGIGARRMKELDLGEEIVARWVVLEMEPRIAIPLLLLLPKPVNSKPAPVVVAVAQAGKGALLRERADEFAALLEKGVAVCLPDLRGSGETRAGNGRDRYSVDTPISSTELMLGGTMVGARLRDLRTVLDYMRSLRQLDPRKIAIWGDSLAAVNPPDTNFQVPRHMDGRPRQSEPLGGLLALLTALYDEDIRAVYVRGGLASFHSVLNSQFVHIPHDVVIPGVLTTGDLCDVAAALAPRGVRLDALVDGHNRRLTDEQIRGLYPTTAVDDRPPAEWLLDNM